MYKKDCLTLLKNSMLGMTTYIKYIDRYTNKENQFEILQLLKNVKKLNNSIKLKCVNIMKQWCDKECIVQVCNSNKLKVLMTTSKN